jgi:hypothetical protein
MTRCTWLDIIAPVSIGILGCVPYYNACDGGFVFDDIFAIRENKDVLSGGWDVFVHDFWGQDISKMDSHKSYRPITTLSFRANYLLSVCRRTCRCVTMCLILEEVEVERFVQGALTEAILAWEKRIR